MVAGAIGNVADRVARGHVVDFIHVRFWPVFNVADVLVAVGVGLLALTQLRRRNGHDGAGRLVDPEDLA